MREEALDFLALCHKELGWDKAKHLARKAAVIDAIESSAT